MSYISLRVHHEAAHWYKWLTRSPEERAHVWSIVRIFLVESNWNVGVDICSGQLPWDWEAVHRKATGLDILRLLTNPNRLNNSYKILFYFNGKLYRSCLYQFFGAYSSTSVFIRGVFSSVIAHPVWCWYVDQTSVRFGNHSRNGFQHWFIISTRQSFNNLW